jgi:hypothetical protein
MSGASEPAAKAATPKEEKEDLDTDIFDSLEREAKEFDKVHLLVTYAT